MWKELQGSTPGMPSISNTRSVYKTSLTCELSAKRRAGQALSGWRRATPCTREQRLRSVDYCSPSSGTTRAAIAPTVSAIATLAPRTASVGIHPWRRQYTATDEMHGSAMVFTRA